MVRRRGENFMHAFLAVQKTEGENSLVYLDDNLICMYSVRNCGMTS